MSPLHLPQITWASTHQDSGLIGGGPFSSCLAALQASMMDKHAVSRHQVDWEDGMRRGWHLVGKGEQERGL
jgi:hypothetical protein